MQIRPNHSRKATSGDIRPAAVSLILLLVFLLAIPDPIVRAQSFDPPPTAFSDTNQSSSIITLVGWFTIIWGDPAPGSAEGSAQTYWLIDEKGQATQLVLDEAMTRSLGGSLALNRKRVQVTGRAREGSKLEVQFLQPSLAQHALLPNSVEGPQPWVSILCKFADVPAEPKPLSYFEGMYSSQYPGLDHYWQEVSYAIANVQSSDAVGWYTLPQPRSYYVYDMDGDGDLDLDFNRAAVDCTAAADADVYFPDFVGVNLMFNYDLDCCAWGGAWVLELDGITRAWYMTWEPPWAYEWITVIAHEMGHGFGLPHSASANSWDIMSEGYDFCYLAMHPTYGCLAQHTIAFHKDLLGWIPPARQRLSNAFYETLTIERLALPQTSGVQMVRIPINGSSNYYYTVEARRTVGYDVKLPGNAVIIHDIDRTRDIPAYVVDIDGNGYGGDAGAMWTVGETFDDPVHHISVTVDAATATGYVITIQQQPMPVRLTPADNRILLPGPVAFSWISIPDASGYDMQIDNVPTFDSPHLIATSVVSPAYNHSFVTLGARYWRIRALPGGPWTSAWQFRITDNVVAINDGPDEDRNPALTTTANGQLVSVWEQSWGLRLARSTDQGATWSLSIPLTQQCCYSAPALVRRSNDHLWLAYTFNGDVWYQTSSDNGVSWSSARQVTSHPDYDGEPDIAELANGEMWIVWKSDRNGQSEIGYSKSANGGATWSIAAEIPNDPSWQGHPTIAQAPDGKIWVFWFRGYGLAYSVTTDGGITWSPLEYMEAGGPILAPNLRRGADGSLWLGYTLVYWTAGVWRTNLYYKTSGDNGVTWSEPQQFTNFVGDNVDVALAPQNGGAMAMAWRSNRSNNFDIWFGLPGLREDVNPPPYVWPIEHLPAPYPDSNDLITFRAWALDETGIDTVSLIWSLNGSPQPELAMVDDGQHGDDEAGDSVYGVRRQPYSAGDTVEYRSRAVDSDGNTFVSNPQWFTVYHWADFDHNGHVDIYDLSSTATCWSQPIEDTCSSDYDSDFDGDIDIADILRVAAAWSP